MKAGPALLQNMSRCSAWVRSHSFSSYNVQTVFAPTGYPPRNPSTNAEALAPVWWNSLPMTPDNSRPNRAAPPVETRREERMKKGNRAGTTRFPHSSSPFLAA